MLERKWRNRTLAVLFVFLSLACTEDTREVWLDDLELKHIDQAAGGAVKNKSMWNTPLIIAGDTFPRGVGSHASGAINIKLDGGSRRFRAAVGIDDSAPDHELAKATVEFLVMADGELLWSSDIMRGGDRAKTLDLDLSGVDRLDLLMSHADDGIIGDRANWVNARFDVVGESPQVMRATREADYQLTPPAVDYPQLNNPGRVGTRPGVPFQYKVPATGLMPKDYSISGLPDGLAYDKHTGIISGQVLRRGTYPLALKVTNKLASTESTMKLVVGDQLSLTPPMGWNSWNVFGSDIDQNKIKRMADAMVSSGLIDHGYTYINIDDGWQGERGGKYNAIMPNERFPDMKGLVDYIHSLGLKAGIYSSPWVTSYANFRGGSADTPDGTVLEEGKRHGKYSFHEEDVKQWTEWGFDYLKYDWNPIDQKHCKLMSDALARSGRNYIYTLSNAAPFEEADQWAKLSNAWRTTFDIKDSWYSMTSIGFTQNKWAPFAGPGHWNDPDMLVVGHVGWGDPHPSKLTPNEQYVHISQWSLLAAPLLIGCDLSALDDFTLNLLANREVIAINQDELGQQGYRLKRSKENQTEVWIKPLVGGDLAVGFFNLNETPQNIAVSATEMSIEGSYTVRDVWRQQNIGEFSDVLKKEVPRHGVFYVRLQSR
ncbi:MAG: NPCBM/NEW2 domain-containing protein [Cyclobacteriaceae bacterium]|nr:NPCBM/NEW2 domain-containing protein [Cyclobacteriaceae bacterium HetDA_MAG_MS6]